MLCRKMLQILHRSVVENAVFLSCLSGQRHQSLWFKEAEQTKGRFCVWECSGTPEADCANKKVGQSVKHYGGKNVHPLQKNAD